MNRKERETLARVAEMLLSLSSGEPIPNPTPDPTPDPEPKPKRQGKRAAQAVSVAATMASEEKPKIRRNAARKGIEIFFPCKLSGVYAEVAQYLKDAGFHFHGQDEKWYQRERTDTLQHAQNAARAFQAIAAEGGNADTPEPVASDELLPF